MTIPRKGVKGIEGFPVLYPNKHPRLYRIWRGMLGRCRVKSDNSYRYYGAKGVTVCDEWLDFNAFQLWALSNGYADNLLIDRERASGNYEPSNCRWVDNYTSLRNQRTTINTPNGTIAEIADSIGISKRAVHYRMDNDISLKAPKMRGGKVQGEK